MNLRQQAIDHAREWANRVNKDLLPQGIFLFGSAIYKNGEQFNSGSDIDLVVVFPNDANDPIARSEWAGKLLKRKHELELSLLQLLHRNKADEPIVSIVLVSQLELTNDLHKSGAPNFFKNSQFLNLITGTQSIGIPTSTEYSMQLSPLARQVLQFTQGARNKYLGIAPNGNRPAVPSSQSDPLPKDCLRHCAMLAACEDAEPIDAGQQFDVKEGLDYITNRLYAARQRNGKFRAIHDFVSLRRGARGENKPLDHDEYILLCEFMSEPLLRSPASCTIRSQSVEANQVAQASPQVQSIAANGYKLYYFRMNNHMTAGQLAKASGVDIRKIRKIERMRRPLTADANSFIRCSTDEIARLEQTLDCPDQLGAGRADDFQT